MDNEAIGEFVDIDSLIPHPDNPRINNHAVEEVAGSIKRFGFASPIIARLEDRMIIAGHTRYKAAQSIGLDKVPVRFMDLDPVDAKLLMLADNKIGERASWDYDSLHSILDELKEENLEGLGFDEDELEFIMRDTSGWDDELSDEEIEGEVSSMENQSRRGLLFDFYIEDYNKVLAIQKKLRQDGVYIGGLILKALEQANEDT